MVYETFIKQLDGCTYCSGGLNCTAASEAMWLYRSSRGQIHLTACQVRQKTGDRSGGTHLGQMEAISIQYGITNGRVYRPLAWSTLESLIATGRYGAILQVLYKPLSRTKYDCFGGKFTGNHAMYVSGPGATKGTWRVGDPGADGRRSGIPKGYQDIPISLLKTAAGKLLVNLQGAQLGYGKAFAYVTPPDATSSAPHYKATVSTATALWNDSTKKWVYSSSPIPVGTVLEVRGTTYPKGGKDCYPVTSGHCANAYAGYYVPKANTKLGTRC